MKFGPRKPNLKKRVKARTTGKIKRQVKRSVNPLYGKKGMGWVRDPKRAAYNKVYNKTTFDAVPSFSKNTGQSTSSFSALGCLALILLVISMALPPLLIFSVPFLIYSIQTGKKEKEKNAYFQSFYHDLTNLEKKIQRNQEIKGLVPFFERMDEIQKLQVEVLDQLNEGFKKEFLTKEKHLEGKEEIDRVLSLLLKDYIDRYEAWAFEEALKLKTEKGRQNNYQRSYEDLMAYEEYFTADTRAYLKENWREID